MVLAWRDLAPRCRARAKLKDAPMVAAGQGSGTPCSAASLGKFRVLFGWESPARLLRSPHPIAPRGGGCPLPASFPVLAGAKQEPATPLLVKRAARPPRGLGATSSHMERRCRAPGSMVWGASGGFPCWCQEQEHCNALVSLPVPLWHPAGSAGCRGAEASVSPATAPLPCLQALLSPPTSPALSNAAPATSSAPGRPAAPPATPPTSWCSGESGAMSPWQL